MEYLQLIQSIGKPVQRYFGVDPDSESHQICQCHARFCKTPGKHRFSNEVGDASDDLEAIRNWVQSGNNIGIEIDNSTVAMTSDGSSNAEFLLNELEKLGILPVSCKWITPEGASVNLYRTDAPARTFQVAKGLSAKGSGSRLLLPPSRDRCKRQYIATRTSRLKPLHPWLSERLSSGCGLNLNKFIANDGVSRLCIPRAELLRLSQRTCQFPDDLIFGLFISSQEGGNKCLGEITASVSYKAGSSKQ